MRTLPTRSGCSVVARASPVLLDLIHEGDLKEAGEAAGRCVLISARLGTSNLHVRARICTIGPVVLPAGGFPVTVTVVVRPACLGLGAVVLISFPSFGVGACTHAGASHPFRLVSSPFCLSPLVVVAAAAAANVHPSPSPGHVNNFPERPWGIEAEKERYFERQRRSPVRRIPRGQIKQRGLADAQSRTTHNPSESTPDRHSARRPAAAGTEQRSEAQRPPSSHSFRSEWNTNAGEKEKAE